MNSRVIARGHEADFLTVGLVGDRQSKPTRLGAHLTLRERADRKTRARELILGQRKEEVRLILARSRRCASEANGLGGVCSTRA